MVSAKLRNGVKNLDSAIFSAGMIPVIVLTELKKKMSVEIMIALMNNATTIPSSLSTHPRSVTFKIFLMSAPIRLKTAATIPPIMMKEINFSQKLSMSNLDEIKFDTAPVNRRESVIPK